MPLQRGEVRGYDFNRMTVDFTMRNQGKVIARPEAAQARALSPIRQRRCLQASLITSRRFAEAALPRG
jgi:hypothetical protein